MSVWYKQKFLELANFPCKPCIKVRSDNVSIVHSTIDSENILEELIMTLVMVFKMNLLFSQLR